MKVKENGDENHKKRKRHYKAIFGKKIQKNQKAFLARQIYDSFRSPLTDGQ